MLPHLILQRHLEERRRHQFYKLSCSVRIAVVYFVFRKFVAPNIARRAVGLEEGSSSDSRQQTLQSHEAPESRKVEVSSEALMVAAQRARLLSCNKLAARIQHRVG